VIHDGMPHDSIQFQDHRGSESCKNGRFRSVSSAVIHVIKRLTVNYDASS